MKTEPSDLLDAYFAEIGELRHAPEYAYGVTIAGERVAGHNTARPFRIASMTKSFTSAAILLLRDRGQLTLDTPVATIVPELKSLQLPTTDSPDVTVRQLMTMSSGLAFDDPWADRGLDASAEQMDVVLSGGAYFAVAPGTRFVYSSYGYAILGRVITNVAGVPYSDFITTELLEPLNMKSTTWTTPESYASPHRLRDGNAIADEPDVMEGDGGFGSMGGLWSTADDILIWANVMLDAFPARDGADIGPLRRASRREMQQVSRSVGTARLSFGESERVTSLGYGMGLNIRFDEVLGMTVDHSGGLPGYGSNMLWSPDHNIAIAWFANITYSYRSEVNPGALDLLHETGLLPEKTALATGILETHAAQLVALLNAWDDGIADEIFLENVKLDEPYERRRQSIAGIAKAPFRLTNITALNSAVAEARLTDAHDQELALNFSLSSRAPARIQAFEIKPVAREHS